MDVEQLVERVVDGPWPDRVAAIRAVPAEFPGKEHQAVYAEISRAFYTEKLAPHFHIVPWLPTFADRDGFFQAYEAASTATDGFTRTDAASIAEAIEADPRSLRIFRLVMGYSQQELADTVAAFGEVPLGKSAIARLEDGGTMSSRVKDAIRPAADVISMIVEGTGGHMVSDELRERGFRGKTDKPDTEEGWKTVAEFARDGVPYVELLYQRFYGGAFRQLQDAGGTRKGDLLEDATEAIFTEHGVPFVRTLPGTQATAGDKFGIAVHPAPDFILHDGSVARGLLECKSAGDGGTARDKAGRFANLRREGERLGGIPVLAVLEGLGWRRVNDALGPVVRDCDGRVFTTSNLSEMLEVAPVADLVGLDHTAG
jgi:hypothetical protein